MIRVLLWVVALGWTAPFAFAIYIGLNYLGYLEGRVSGATQLHSFPYRSALAWALWIGLLWLALAIGIVVTRTVADRG